MSRAGRRLRSAALAGALLTIGVTAGLGLGHGEDVDLAPARGPETYIAVLNGGQAVPATDSGALGVAYLTFDRKSGTLTYSVTLQGLEGVETATHLHAGAGGEVRKPHLFHLGAGNVKNGSVDGFHRGMTRLLRRGQLYINVHTDLHTGGEIRGQVLPVKGAR